MYLLYHSMLYICCRSFTAVCVDFLWQLFFFGGGDKDVWYIIVSCVYANSMFVSGGGGVDLPTSRGQGCLLLVLSVFRSASLNGVSSFIYLLIMWGGPVSGCPVGCVSSLLRCYHSSAEGSSVARDTSCGLLDQRGYKNPGK